MILYKHQLILNLDYYICVKNNHGNGRILRWIYIKSQRTIKTFGTVHSVERNETAVKLIYKNKEKFSADNLFIYEGDAAKTACTLPEPDKVFIGGSGKELSQILETIAAFPKKIKVVISAVTIETIAEANELLGKYDTDFDVIQATVGRGRKIGSYHIMDTNNPVMIFTAHI